MKESTDNMFMLIHHLGDFMPEFVIKEAVLSCREFYDSICERSKESVFEM